MKFQIAKGAAILIGCKFACKGYFSIGENSVINQNCHIDNRGGVEISSNVSIGPQCAFITADHVMDSPTFESRNRSIKIQQRVFLGFGVVILGGVSVKRGGAIGALSLVLKDTEEFTVYTGQPAKKLRMRNENLNYILNYRRLFH